MRALSTSGLSVELLLRVIDVKYGCFTLLYFTLRISFSTDIMNHKPRLAWELYLKMETSGESFSLLQLIANDCYKVCRKRHIHAT